jgi:hypothetical protein
LHLFREFGKIARGSLVGSGIIGSFVGGGGRGVSDSCSSRFGFILLLAAAVLVATSPATTLATDGPRPASEKQSETDSDKALQEEEKKKGFWDRFKDPEDGKLDLTAASEEEAGFFPIAIPFNEPALGVGLVLAMGYFHPDKNKSPASSGQRTGPPTTTFGAVAGTTNNTWFAAGGHHHVWKDDGIRYLGAVGGGSINLTYYGLGDEGTSADDGRDFNIKVIGLVQQVKFRIAKLPVFVGAKYVYAATDTTFDVEEVGPVTGETDLAGISGLFEYDTRDTVFTPNKGFQASLDLSWFSEALGGDFDFGAVDTAFRYYWPLPEHWVLGFRVDYDVVGDEAPFYALSYVKLRGVPVFRYLGNYVATLEIEPRYKIGRRWSVIAFTGVGRAARTFSGLADADKVYSIGTGFRYLIARKLGLGAGVDIARGPEETVPYITVGSAW